MHTVPRDAESNLENERRASICLLGAPFDTGNLGVSALGESVVRGLSRRVPGATISVFDHGRGERRIQLGSGSNGVGCQGVGAKLTRRLHQPEAYWRIARAARRGGARNLAAQRLLEAQAILDISGGDSFTDLYGAWRFDQVTRLKLLALDLARPLVLLPQTYGPFDAPESERVASDIVRRAALAWARDERSFGVLGSLLGESFDPSRHRSGVDVAFALPRADPGDRLDQDSRRWLDQAGTIRVGLNVSGLLWHSPDSAREQYGFECDYRQVMTDLARRLLEHESVSVLLVPHVLTPPGHYESDYGASRELQQTLGARVLVADPSYSASEVKWIISHSDWFCGTRMHSTIAGLSSGTPSSAIAYSPKTLGVFESCAMGEHVADPRSATADDVVDKLLWSFERRDSERQILDRSLPGVLDRAEGQLDVIAAFVTGAPLPSSRTSAHETLGAIA